MGVQEGVEAVGAGEVEVMRTGKVEVEEGAEWEATAEAVRRMETCLRRESSGAFFRHGSLRVMCHRQPLKGEALCLTLR